jgi:hypothetical protein
MTLYEWAERLVGEIPEIEGAKANAFIQWCHGATTLGQFTDDAISWCSSFINRGAWHCRLQRSKLAAARSWVGVGVPLTFARGADGVWTTDAQRAANDIVVLKRGTDHGPEAGDGEGGFAKGTWPPGHVGIFMGFEGDKVWVLGGNQGNNVSLARFNAADVIALRRLRAA